MFAVDICELLQMIFLCNEFDEANKGLIIPLPGSIAALSGMPVKLLRLIQQCFICAQIESPPESGHSAPRELSVISTNLPLRQFGGTAPRPGF